jgi:hypothetical protein
MASLEGALNLNNVPLKAGDAIKVWDELGLTLTAVEDSHLVIVEMPRIPYNAGHSPNGQNHHLSNTTR